MEAANRRESSEANHFNLKTALEKHGEGRLDQICDLTKKALAGLGLLINVFALGQNAEAKPTAEGSVLDPKTKLLVEKLSTEQLHQLQSALQKKLQEIMSQNSDLSKNRTIEKLEKAIREIQERINPYLAKELGDDGYYYRDDEPPNKSGGSSSKKEKLKEAPAPRSAKTLVTKSEAPVKQTEQKTQETGQNIQEAPPTTTYPKGTFGINPNSSVVYGFNIYYGPASREKGAYKYVVDVGAQTYVTIELKGMEPEDDLYAACTAYDPSKNESSFSNEVSKPIPPKVNVEELPETSFSEPESIGWSDGESGKLDFASILALQGLSIQKVGKLSLDYSQENGNILYLPLATTDNQSLILQITESGDVSILTSNILNANLAIPVGEEEIYVTDRTVGVPGDLNLDGKTDLLTASSKKGSVIKALKNADGTFNSTLLPTDKPLEIPYKNLTIGDLNGDGLPEIVAVGGDKITIYFPNGAGNYTPKTFDYSGNLVDVKLLDANQDGSPELILLDAGAPPQIVIAAVSSEGELSIAPTDIFPLSEGSVPTQMELGDLNGDGLLDLIIANNPPEELSSLLARIGNWPDGITEENFTYSLPEGEKILSKVVGYPQGDSSKMTVYISTGAGIEKIIPAPQAEFNVSMNGLTVACEDISRGWGTKWRWDFNDGYVYETSDPANKNPPPHTYTSTGSHTITETVTGPGGTSQSAYAAEGLESLGSETIKIKKTRKVRGKLDSRVMPAPEEWQFPSILDSQIMPKGDSLAG